MKELILKKLESIERDTAKYRRREKPKVTKNQKDAI